MLLRSLRNRDVATYGDEDGESFERISHSEGLQ